MDSASMKGVVHNKSIINASKVSFTSEERFFSLEFSALDYDMPNLIEYYYRLLPNSENWFPLERQSDLTFINLSPGTYTIEVKSTNSDGVLCDNAKSIIIEILPPFWKQKWVIAIAGLLVLLLIFFLVQIRIYRLSQSKKKLEEIVDFRTREIEIRRNIAHRQRDEIFRQKNQIEEFARDLEEKVKARTYELEKAKERAVESDQLKSAFLSNMSHEIRTPMNAIIGFSELLLESSFSDKERFSFAHMIKTNGDSLLNLLNDIIDISMIESGQLKIARADVDVVSLLKSTFSTFAKSPGMLAKNELELRLECSITSLFIHTDKFRLTQILNNLISNAIKFTAKGHVTIGLKIVDNEFVEFYVEDTGIGIDLSYQRHIFDRFRKVETDKANLYRGNGLGLTITKNLIEILNGSIGLYSEVNKGSRFHFQLPL